MWNSFLSSTDSAKERLVSVLEKTGEALHQKATAHVRQTKLSHQEPSNPHVAHSEPAQQATNKEGSDEATGPILTPFFISPTASVSKYIKGLRNTTENSTDADESTINGRAKDVLLDTLKVGWGSVVKVVESTQKVVEKEIASLQASALIQKGSFRISEFFLYHGYVTFHDFEY